MNKPSEETIETVAPAYAIDELPISDGTSVRNVAHAEQLDTLRLPRGGRHEATLVAAKKYYDGSGGGEAGSYVMLFVEFRDQGTRWRTAGVKVRAVEAARIGKALVAHKPSKPGRSEPARVGGKVLATDDSELRGAPVPDGYAIYVRHHPTRGEGWVRTRGVVVLPHEREMVAVMLARVAS